MGEGVLLSLWLCDVDGTACGDGAGCVLSKGEGILLSFWLCDVDGTASGDGAGCALICSNKNIIIIIYCIQIIISIPRHEFDIRIPHFFITLDCVCVCVWKVCMCDWGNV